MTAENTPPVHTFTVQETERLLGLISENRKYLDTIFPAKGQNPTDELVENYTASLSLSLLDNTEWMGWIKVNGYSEFTDDGQYRQSGDWSGYQNPVRTRLRQMAQVYEQCQANIVSSLTTEVQGPSRALVNGFERYRNSPKRAWLWTYACMKYRQETPPASTDASTKEIYSSHQRTVPAHQDSEPSKVPPPMGLTSLTPAILPCRQLRPATTIIDLVTDSEDSSSIASDDEGDESDNSSIIELPSTPVRKRRRSLTPISIDSTPSPPHITLPRPTRTVTAAQNITPRRVHIPFHRRQGRDQDEESEPTDSDSEVEPEPRRPSYTRAELGNLIFLTTDDQLASMFMDDTIRPHHHWRTPFGS